MTEEAKRCVEIMHERGCRGCLMKELSLCVYIEEGRFCDNAYHESADLIESMSAQLEQVEQERDGLNIMLAQAQAMLETRTRERDAAIRDMQKTPITLCAACSHYHTEFCCAGGEGCEDICMTIACSMFEWRNIQEEG